MSKGGGSWVKLCKTVRVQLQWRDPEEVKLCKMEGIIILGGKMMLGCPPPPCLAPFWSV